MNEWAMHMNGIIRKWNAVRQDPGELKNLLVPPRPQLGSLRNYVSFLLLCAEIHF